MVTQRLSRSAHDKMIGGVCGGLGRYFGIDPVFVRLIMIALMFAGGISLLIYPVLWLVMPLEGMSQATLGANLHEIRREAKRSGNKPCSRCRPCLAHRTMIRRLAHRHRSIPRGATVCWVC